MPFPQNLLLRLQHQALYHHRLFPRVQSQKQQQQHQEKHQQPQQQQAEPPQSSLQPRLTQQQAFTAKSR